MMTVAPVASAADAAGYYSSKDNYYFLDDMPTQWMGEGARELGLEGPVVRAGLCWSGAPYAEHPSA